MVVMGGGGALHGGCLPDLDSACASNPLLLSAELHEVPIFRPASLSPQGADLYHPRTGNFLSTVPGPSQISAVTEVVVAITKPSLQMRISSVLVPQIAAIHVLLTRHLREGS